MPPVPEQLTKRIEELIATHHVTIFSKTTCPYCVKVKSLFNSLHAEYHCVELNQLDDGPAMQDALASMTGQRSVPNVFIGGKHVGGNDTCQELFRQRELIGMLRNHGFQYDLIVVGGGSGGLAAAKEAAQLGAKVACFDFVTPTPNGTTWGLGGTCVNVGCIPKKLMHQAACLSEAVSDAAAYGWEGVGTRETVRANWATLRAAVQDHIGSLNWGYRVQLRSNKVDYQNRWAKLAGPNTVIGRDRGGKEVEYTAKRILVAVGERPNYPDNVPGARELGITSDDLFSLEKPPGETVVVGASYVALECAGFLAAMGFKVHVVVRSILLRGFDQEMAELIGSYMTEHSGIKFIRPALPVSLERDADSGRINFRVKVTNDGVDSEQTLQCDTVLFAIGRAPVFSQLGLESAGISLSKAGRILVNEADGTSCDSVFAIGDAAEGRPQLTPAAIQAGRMLARRLYGGAKENCDYSGVPTTVFTPLEYSCCGLSEDVAIEQLGRDGVTVYHKNFNPLEWSVPHRPDNVCYMKLVCKKAANADEEGREPILGLHYLGPNAGEVMQGFALGLKKGATKWDLDNTIGIHPTNAEWFTTLDVVKGSGVSAAAAGC